MRISAGPILIAIALAGGDAAARDIHYGAVDDPDLGRCDQIRWRGELDESTACYRELLQRDLPSSIHAEAAWALDDLQLANRLFRVAAEAAPDDPGVRVRWGDLFSDTHQDAEAMNLYREALAIDASYPFALLGSARVLVGGFDDEANAFLEPLLTDDSMHPGARIGAWLLVARIALESGNRSQADSAMDSAAALLAQSDWPPLELYALRASADLLDNITESRYTAMSLDFNPRYGGIYAVPARFYVITRRYREAIDLYQKAVDIDPSLSSAHEALGINLLRDNQFSRARRHLETAYGEDPFSPQSVNTLRLLDSLENFRLINDPLMPERGVLPIIMRLHREEADAIAPYAVDLTRQSIEVFTERYGFELKEPVVIEMYPDHEDFAVRTAGMPGIPILGATFGYVVAMDSPSARPPREFQWGTTLWHEMAHVFTLEATAHLVPRWFSEGVSVFEEWRSGPTPGVRVPMSVLNAMKEDRFLPVATLDEGFLRPTYEEQIIVSYMQAGLICLFIDERYGSPKLKALLDAFGEGLQTGDAITRVFDRSPGTFDDEFDEFIEARYGDLLASFDHWHRTRELLLGSLRDEDWSAVIEPAEHMIELYPNYVEPDSPYVALARAFDELDRRDDAIAALTRFWQNGGYDPSVLKRLAGWLVTESRPDTAIDVLETVTMVDPFDRDLHGQLGDLLMDAGRAEDASREYEILIALDPHDKANAYYRMARAKHALGDREASQSSLIQALEIAPNYRPAQRLLLELMRADVSDEQQ